MADRGEAERVRGKGLGVRGKGGRGVSKEVLSSKFWVLS